MNNNYNITLIEINATISEGFYFLIVKDFDKTLFLDVSSVQLVLLLVILYKKI